MTWVSTKLFRALPLLLVVVVSVGCVRTKFTPYETAQGSLSPVTKQALEAHEGDIDHLVAAGAFVVGTIDARGAPLASMSSVHGKTSRDAARHGATHVIIADEQYIHVKLSPDRATTTCYGNTCQTEFHEGATGNAKRASYVLIRVAPGNWGRLPDALRPVPLDSVRDEVEEGILAASNSSGPPQQSSTQAAGGLLSIPDVARLAKASLVVVRTEKGSGSGFAISSGGWVATSFHVVAGAGAISIEDPTGQVHPVSALWAFDRANDLAILDAPSLILPPLRMTTVVPEVGVPVVVVGHPRGLTATVSDGIVAAVRQQSDGTGLLQVTAPISPGSSGGPILNMHGHVVGVTSGYLDDAQNLNFASLSTALAQLAMNAPPRPLPLARFAAFTGARDRDADSVPQASTGATPNPDRAPFPGAVAGFKFGATVADARLLCSESRAEESVTWLRADKNWAECPFLPVPLHFAAPPVGLAFYAGQLANIVFPASSFNEARAALIAKYGEPDAVFAYHVDTQVWEETEAWREGEPGGVLWNLRGGTVQMASMDGVAVIVRYVPAAAHAMETDNY